jgi:hypothetical protein
VYLEPVLLQEQGQVAVLPVEEVVLHLQVMEAVGFLLETF